MEVVYVQYEAVHCGRHGYFESFSVYQEGLEDLWLSFRYREGYGYGRWGSVSGRLLKARSLCFEVEAIVWRFFGKILLRSAWLPWSWIAQRILEDSG